MHPETLPNYDTNRELYLRFAENRRRTRAEIMDDFHELLREAPAVGFMAGKPHIMLVQTPILHITHDECTYEVGSIICMFLRARDEANRRWFVDYRFKRALGPVPNQQQFVHHPHVFNHEDDEIFGPDVGTLCISDGEKPLQRALLTGQMNRAYAIALDILLTYPTGQPYKKIELWPIVEDDNA